MAGKVLDMQTGLSQINETLASMEMSPDADQEFIQDLRSVVVAKAHGQAQQGQQQGAQPGAPGQSPQGGGAPVAGPGGPPPGPPGQGGPPQGGPPAGGPNPQMAQQMAARGVQQRPDMPNPDELRRLLLTRAGS